MQPELTKENNKQIIDPNKRNNFNENAKQLLEQRPRSTGFKSFLNWFKKVENLQRNVEEENSSLSDSSEDDSSTSSTATVASFSFLPANIYKPYGDACQPEKFIASGPYTETYHRLITERNRRRNLDKNLSLRKKYSLYSSGTLGGKLDPATHHKVIHAENANIVQVYDTFSLPALAKKGDYDMEDFKDNRKTASLSSKDAKTAVNCHVKGKRKAPQPPGSLEFSKTYRKKRQAPPPPKQVLFYTSHITEENTVISEPEQQTQFREKHKLLQTDVQKNSIVNITPSELSPKPWYKRQGSENKVKTKNVKNNPAKKKNKHEYPEVGFFRCSRIFENKKQVPSETSDQDNKQEKRASCLLPNISELDREAAEIIKHHKKDLENRSDNSNIKQNQEHFINKPSSARELINKFNALTNATDNDKSSVHQAKDDSNTSDEKTPHNLSAKQNDINIISNDLCSENSKMPGKVEKCSNNEKANNIKKPCILCGLENMTSGNTCINCINVRLTKAQDSKQENERNKNASNYVPPQSFQAEVFSAIANFNFSENKITTIAETENLKIVETTEDDMNKQQKLTSAEEKFRLRELLKEMKNSLPKRPKPTKPLDLDLTNEELKNEIVLPPATNHLQSANNENLPSNIKTVPSNIFDIPQTKTRIGNVQISLTQTSSDIISTKEERLDLKSPKINVSESTKTKNEKSNQSNERLMIVDRSVKDSIANKVSSSAQTNCMIKKSDQLACASKPNIGIPGAELKKEKLPNNQTKDAPQMEAIKEEPKQIQMASNALYINVQESRAVFPKPQTSDQQKNNGNTKLLLKQLETAIAQGNDLLAAKLAKDLALLKVNCSVTSTATINAKEVNTKSIQIYIEDQFSHQGPISLRVKEDITITDLKTRVFVELHIPAGVQRWIIGKQLTTSDNLTLAHFNGNDFEVPLFLYVVAPVSELKTEKEVHNLPVPTEIAVSNNTPVKSEIVANIEEPKKVNNKLPLKINTDLQEVKKAAPPAVNVSPGPSKIKLPAESPALKDVAKKTWICSACTLINSLLSPLCSACGSRKSLGLEKKIDKKVELKPVPNEAHYLQLVNLDNADLVLNTEQFECPVCLMDCKPKAGVTLRECLHSFCKECLANTVKCSEEAEIKCPYRDKEYFCDSTIQEREIKSLVNKTLYEKHLAKSVNVAENKIKNTFHCKSPDCKGWCIFEENVNDFLCPVCKKTNCLTCQAIHEGKNCKEHQAQMSEATAADGLRTKVMLEEMVSRGEAMVCPSCQVVLMKKWGCDWLRCSMCKTEICWVTRGPRWGAAGKGDTSGGCQCGLNGVKCHPKCNYCH